jgi:hypothetical protein
LQQSAERSPFREEILEEDRDRYQARDHWDKVQKGSGSERAFDNQAATVQVRRFQIMAQDAGALQPLVDLAKNAHDKASDWAHLGPVKRAMAMGPLAKKVQSSRRIPTAKELGWAAADPNFGKSSQTQKSAPKKSQNKKTVSK